MNKNNFDFLRLFFAFIVALWHMFILADINFYIPIFSTHLSVTGFFIISGFLIAKSYSSSNSLKSYIKKRAARILPAYIFVVTICAILFATISNYSFLEYFTNFELYKYYFSNIFFLNFLHPTLPGVFNQNTLPTINGALWTIKVEVLFYIFLPFFIYFVKNKSKKIVYLVLLYLIAITYTHYLDSQNTSLSNILSHQLPGFLNYFACGIAMFFYFDFFYKNKLILLFIGILIYSIELYFNLEILRPLALSFIIFYLAYSFPKINNFSKYGDFSYGLYIFHFPIIQIFVYFGLFKNYNTILISSICLITIFAISILSWKFIEKPFLKKVRKI